MSRTSRVPYHQNVYDLLGAEAFAPAVREIEQCEGWEAETGLRFPAAMREVYTQRVRLRYEPAEPWVDSPTIRWWWASFEPDDYICRLDEILYPQPDVPWCRVPIDALPGHYFGIAGESQGRWGMYARHDGSDDPPVWATDTCFLSPNGNDYASPEWSELGWHRLGTFAEVVWRWIAGAAEATPLPNWHEREDWYPILKVLPPAHQNGLWLRAPAEPFAPPIVDFLTEQFGEPERPPCDGDVTTYTWRPDGAAVRVTADHPAHPEPLSAWWVHAPSPEQLAALAELLKPWGMLAHTLRADTDQARDVWNRVRTA